MRPTIGVAHRAVMLTGLRLAGPGLMEPTRLRNAVSRYAKARSDRDRAIREAAAAGMKHREIAAIAGISNQLVHQIIKAPSG